MILCRPLYPLPMHSVISAMPGDDQKLQRFLLRKPRRITITLPQLTAELLGQRRIREGRSLSNLVAVLLERAITAEQIQLAQQSSRLGRLSPQSQQDCHG